MPLAGPLRFAAFVITAMAPGKKTVLLTLTEAQRGEIRQAFDLFDTEGQGASICSTAPTQKRC